MAHSCTLVGDDEATDRVKRVVVIAVIEVLGVCELHVRMSFLPLRTFVCEVALLPAHKTSDLGHVPVVAVGLVSNKLRVLLIRYKLGGLLLERHILICILVAAVVVPVLVPTAVPAISPASVDAVPIRHDCFCGFDNGFWKLVGPERELLS